jgi:hypothetical protein
MKSKLIVFAIFLMLASGCLNSPHPPPLTQPDFFLLENFYPDLSYYYTEEQKNVSAMLGTINEPFWNVKIYDLTLGSKEYLVIDANFSRLEYAEDMARSPHRERVSFRSTITKKFRTSPCLYTKDITSYGLGYPIKISSSRDLAKYKLVRTDCSSCECGTVDRIAPTIFVKDGVYYIYAKEIIKEQDKNDCNVYTQIKARMYPIYSIKINSNKECEKYI